MKLIALAFAFFAVATPARASNEFTFKVMTYNINGLPWPIKIQRGEFERIGELLGEMRAQGTEPEIVFLQEGFTPNIVKLIKNSGYPYVYKGPSAKQKGELKSELEKSGCAVKDPVCLHNLPKLANSGIYVLSNFPILKTAKISYGKNCAGLDCAANKGALLAQVEVPGFPEPIWVGDTHMNSSKSSWAKPENYIAARTKQMTILGQFMTEVVPQDATLLFGGDFNTAPRKQPWDFLINTMADRGLTCSEVACLNSPSTCTQVSDDDLDKMLTGSPDHIFYRAGRNVEIEPATIAKTFKVMHKGHWISDHFALEVVFKVRTQ